jgi:hypothetical protein
MALTFYFTGGGSASSVLGGNISSTALTEAQGAVFPDVILADAMAGITHYACIAMKNTGATTINNAGIYISSNVEGSQSYIALGLAGIGTTNPPGATAVVTTEQTIASAVTAPTGTLVFQKPSFSYAPLSIGSLSVGQYKYLWLKRVVAANQTGSPLDYFIITGTES